MTVLVRRTVLAGVAVLLFGGAFSRAADEGPDLKDVKCPICNMPAKKDLAVDYKGGKVYFGCAGCPSAFKRNTAKYAAKANAQLVATKQAYQKSCPVMGGKVKKNLKIKVAGVNVLLCCKRCKNRLASLKPEEQLAKVFNDKTFAKAFVVGKKEKK